MIYEHDMILHKVNIWTFFSTSILFIYLTIINLNY